MKTKLGLLNPPNLNVVFSDFLIAFLKYAWQLAEYSDDDIIETAVETTSILVLDSKRVSLETRLKKKSNFCFDFLRSKQVLYDIHLESIVSFLHCGACRRKTDTVGKIGTCFLSLESNQVIFPKHSRSESKSCTWIPVSNNWLFSAPFSALFVAAFFKNGSKLLLMNASIVLIHLIQMFYHTSFTRLMHALWAPMEPKYIAGFWGFSTNMRTYWCCFVCPMDYHFDSPCPFHSVSFSLLCYYHTF